MMSLRFKRCTRLAEPEELVAASLEESMLDPLELSLDDAVVDAGVAAVAVERLCRLWELAESIDFAATEDTASSLPIKRLASGFGRDHSRSSS